MLTGLNTLQGPQRDPALSFLRQVLLLQEEHLLDAQTLGVHQDPLIRMPLVLIGVTVAGLRGVHAGRIHSAGAVPSVN